MRGTTVFRFLLISVLLAVFASCKSSSKLFAKGEVGLEAFDETIPFTKSKGLMIVQVEIDGESYNFLFDTGAPMVISEELQAKLQCKKLATKQVGDSQGTHQKLAYVQLPALILAGQHFTNLTAIVADLTTAPAIHCLKIDGIIGANLMRMAFWEIDFESDLMRFTNRWENLKIDSSANQFNFYTQSTGTPIIPELFIDSVRIRNVTFDTGSAGILGISKRNLPALKLDSTLKSAYGHLSSGIYGSSVDTNFYVQKTFALGRDTIANFPFEVQNVRTKKLLGMRYFKNYRIVLNWDSKTAYMQKHQTIGIDELTSFGVTFILKDKYLLIGSVQNGSAADLQGISLNDTVLQVNGIVSPVSSADDYCKVLSEMKKVEIIEIELKEKGVFSLKKEPVYALQPEG